MDDAVIVRRLEPLRNLPRDRKRLVQWDRSLRDAVRERRSFNQFENQRLLKPAPTPSCT